MVLVYLSNQYIRVIERTGAKGYHFCSVRDDSGSMVGGAITDEEGFAGLIGRLWEDEKLSKEDVHLMIGGSNMTTRRMEVPSANVHMMLDYVAREFSDVDRITDPVSGYVTSGRERRSPTVTVFGTLASRGVIEQYRRVFAGLSIEITSIESVLSCLWQGLLQLPQLAGRTCILQLADDATLINVLLKEGDILYLNQTRLFAEPQTAEYAAEIVRSVSSLLAFAKTQGVEEAIGHLYVGGLSADTIKEYRGGIEQLDGAIRVDRLSLGIEDETYDLAGTAMYVRAEPTGVYAQFLRDPKREAQTALRRRILIPAGMLVTGVLFILVGLLIRMAGLSAAIRSNEKYLSDETNLLLEQEYTKVLTDYAKQNQSQESLRQLAGLVEAYPQTGSALDEAIRGDAQDIRRASVVSYDSATGQAVIEAVAVSAQQMHLFVERLEQDERFEAVDYPGYAKNGEGLWETTLTVTLRGGEEDDAASDNGEG